jgi:hypothetical protein
VFFGAEEDKYSNIVKRKESQKIRKSLKATKPKNLIRIAETC